MSGLPVVPLGPMFLSLHDEASQHDSLKSDGCHAFSYENTLLFPGQIRLLSVAQDGGVPVCTLSVHHLSESLDFDALSYSWGKQLPTKYIICNQSIFLVTPHLYEALCEIGMSEKQRPIWIDAICINQQDLQEKDDQVPIMDKIYTYCGHVLVWLGRAENGSDTAMNQMSNLRKILSTVEIQVANNDNLPADCPRLEDPIWRAIGHIYARPWFNRLWAFQEAVLGRNILFKCGCKTVDWDTFSSFASDIVRLGLQTLIRGRQAVDQTHGDGLAAMSHFNKVKAGRLNDQRYPVTALLLALRLKDVTNPVDRINGVLGLIDEELKEQLRIGYGEFRKQECWKGYLRAGKVFIRERPFMFLSMSSSKFRPDGLPTWCANLDSPAEFTSFIDDMYQAGISNTRTIRRNIFNVSGSDSICVSGLQFDEVACVVEHSFKWPDIEPMSERIAAANESIAWEDACFSLSSSLFHEVAGVPEAHWRTIIANRIVGNPVAPKENRANDYINMKKCLNFFANPGFPSMRGLDTPEARSLTEYVRNVGHACQGRRFFSTKGGRIGLGPLQVAEGDVVSIFYGATTPFMLRRDSSVKEATAWKMVGDAYVHDIMHGEALNAQEGSEHAAIDVEFTIN